MFSRLSYGDDGDRWTAWPDPERTAIEAFLHAFRERQLASGDDRDDDGARIDDALFAVALADPDIDWYLAAWLRFEHPFAAVNLQRFLMLNAARLSRGRLYNAFWSDNDPPAPQNLRRVVEWTKAETTKDAVAAAADHARTSAEREALEECYLRWLG